MDGREGKVAELQPPTVGGLPEDHGQGWFQFEVGGLDFARVTTHITQDFELYTLKKSRKGKAS